MVKTVSSNGRIRGKTQRRRFESYAIPFTFASDTSPIMKENT